MSKRNPVAHSLNHVTRRRIIEALCHSHEPLTASQFHSDYVDDEKVGLDQTVYHVRQLAQDGIVEFDGDQGKDIKRRSFVLAGPNSSEAVRHMQLTQRRVVLVVIGQQPLPVIASSTLRRADADRDRPRNRACSPVERLGGEAGESV